MTSFKEKVSSLYYTHGLLCASHPLTVFAITFSFVFLCCYPLSKLPFPGNAPLKHTTSLKDYVIPADVTISPDRDDQRPLWYAGSSAGFVLQIVVKATVSPWEREKLYPTDAFRTPLMQVFHILETVQQEQVKSGNSARDLSDICLQVAETLPDRGVRNLLPQYNCLIVSPANIWSLDRTKFDSDGELIKTIYKIAHTLDKTPLLKDILFGVAWPETGVSRFYMRNRQRVISYAITIVMKQYDPQFVNKLRNHLLELYPLYQTNKTSNEMTHIYFKARNYFFLEYTPLIVAYIVLFLYIYFSVRKIEMVKSKWGLALASVATVVASLFMSIGICTFFGLQPILLGSKIYEIFPYLVVIVGLENVLILTKSVVSTPVHMDVKYRIAEGLYKEGWGISKNLLYELLLLLVGFFTFVPEIQEFCLFACVGLLSDFFLQMMFFSTVLGIDIRRMELTDLRSQTTSVVDSTSDVKHPQPMIHCPYKRMTSSPNRRRLERSRSFPNTSHDPSFSSTPCRLRLIEFIARYRLVQRLLMLATAAWISFILYQTGLAAHFIYVTLNSTNDDVRDHYDVRLDEGTKTEELETMLGHDDVDHWTKLSHSHWPTLFGFYNISLWNRYITVLPSVHLSITVHPDSAVKFRHPAETKSKLDWLPPAPHTGDWLPPSDWLPPVPHEHPDTPAKQLLIQAHRFYPKTKREFYVTISLAVASAVVIVYLMVALYGCMCSRNYSKWRSGWNEARSQKRRKYSDLKLYRPGSVVHLIGHCESVECLTCNGQLVISSCLAGEIRVWDSMTGDCLNIIPSTRSQESVYSPREHLLEPVNVDTDFSRTMSQCVDPQTGYDFTPYCSYERGPKRTRSKTTADIPALPAEQRARSRSADSNLSPVNIRDVQIWSLTCQDSVIAAGCSNGRVELWDCINGQLKCTYQPNTATSGITHIILRNSRLVLARLNGYIDFLLLETYVSASVAGSSSQKIYMRGHLRAHSGTWRRESHSLGANDLLICTLLSTSRAHTRTISTLCCEGGRLVSASLDCSIKVYKLDDCMCLYTLHGHEAPVTALCLDQQSPLGAVSGCTNGTVLVWDLLTGACVHKLEREEQCTVISALCTSTYILSTQTDQELCIWERCRGTLLHTIRLDYLTTNSLSMLTSHLMVCATHAGNLQVWDISKAELVHCIQLNGQKPAHTVLAVGNDMVVCDLGNQLRVVPFPSGLGKLE